MNTYKVTFTKEERDQLMTITRSGTHAAKKVMHDNFGTHTPGALYERSSRKRLNGYGTDLNLFTPRNRAVGLIWPK